MDLEKYGHFSDDGKEFVIIRPDTPAPWINYLSNRKYCALVSNTGGGFSFYITPKDNRITRFRYNCLPVDRPGRYVYLRDKETGDYWSLTWQPTLQVFEKKPLDSYECRHGLGYTKISVKYQGIRSEVLYFVPLDDDLEVWRVTLKNETDKPRKFDLFGFVELCLGHALVDLINQPNDQHFNDVFFREEDNTVYATKRYWVTYSAATVKQPNKSWDRYVFFSSSEKIVGFDGSKDKFIGRYRSEADPIVVEQGKCLNTEITAGDAVAVLQNEIILQPGETKELAILLGIVEKLDYIQPLNTEKSIRQARPLVKKYTDLNNVAKELARVKEYYDKFLSTINIETPDKLCNLMLNVWNRWQTNTTFRNGRNTSYYHGGLLFGMGIRDACQDIFSNLISEPDAVRKRILEIYSHQFKDGSTLHCYYPLTGGGEKTGHSDTPLWLPMAVINYLRETGDFVILDEKVDYEDKGKDTVLKHLCGAIDYTISNLTRNNLPKFGPGDWNDTLDYVGRKGKGESVWVAEFLCYILNETLDLLKYLSESNNTVVAKLTWQNKTVIEIAQRNKSLIIKKLNDYNKWYQKIATALNKRCWDGEWYIRGTRDDGGVIGSAKNKEGKIFVNAQSWAVISNIAQSDRAIKCMDSVKKYLDTPKGPKLLHPAYTKPDPGIGLATRCVPGKKENGAVFNHPVSWAILAECLLKRGDIAYEYYQKALPMNIWNSIDIYKMEPYVYAEYVTSPDHPTMGEASHSWLTGSAAWMFKDGLEYILGIRPQYDGLLIDPCIPRAWKGYKIRRVFRGATYEITVENKTGDGHTVKTMELDGKLYRGNKLPVFPKDSRHIIKVVL